MPFTQPLFSLSGLFLHFILFRCCRVFSSCLIAESNLPSNCLKVVSRYRKEHPSLAERQRLLELHPGDDAKSTATVSSASTHGHDGGGRDDRLMMMLMNPRNADSPSSASAPPPSPRTLLAQLTKIQELITVQLRAQEQDAASLVRPSAPVTPITSYGVGGSGLMPLTQVSHYPSLLIYC